MSYGAELLELNVYGYVCMLELLVEVHMVCLVAVHGVGDNDNNVVNVLAVVVL